MGRAERRDSSINYFPYFLAQLHVLDILRQIVQPAEQAQRIAKRRPGCLTETRRDPKPGLLAHFRHDAIFNLLDVDRQRGLPARHCIRARCDLHRNFVFPADHLRVHIPAVELRHQGMGNIVRVDVSVKDSSVHVFDYNPLYERRRYAAVFHLL